MIMPEVSLDQKYELATQVICKQGIVSFPVNDTTISILKHVVEDNEEAERDESSCFGCGICVRFCSEEAISLKEGLRKVFRIAEIS